MGDAPLNPFPLPLSAYSDAPGASLGDVLHARIALDPFNAIATAIFVVAILHTFMAARFSALGHRVQARHDERSHRAGEQPRPSVAAELLHFLGEVEVVFGLWAAVLFVAITATKGWSIASRYVGETVNYTEPMFVVVIMALASTRPIITLAEGALRRLANLGAGTPAAWWLSILTIGPVLGSFITEPGAMTICALLLARQFYDLAPSLRLKYATLGLLFVNISVGGTLTHFAAPPVLMVARVWEWDTAFMLSHIGWRAILALLLSTGCYYVLFKRELDELKRRPRVADLEQADEEARARGWALLPVPGWLIGCHVAFMVWTVMTAHDPALFIGGFLFFLGFQRATAAYQSRLELRVPMLVGFFLAGLVVHGGLQAWWIAPILARLTDTALFVGATILTSFNDNALITYLATLVPSLSPAMQLAVVQGAVTGGGLTVIANAPNPAGQTLLSRFFGPAVSPLYLFLGALLPTAIATVAFRLVP